ncbi:EAL domain-containing protein [Salinimonas lutimaris]|uniref:EAL domain-containing protein n=1 Tax=Salinimonas lutimaris TaxID=914153 RepID=UPI001E3C8F73|nr:EAL domain-containing protein [Salinimonas lutimaris]
MKSLRSEIAAITLLSITMVSSLIMWFSINVYEELYHELVSDELSSLSQNLADDLLPVINESPGAFSVTRILLRFDQYENVEFAKVFDANDKLVNAYMGKAVLDASDPSDISLADEALLDMDFGRHMQDGFIYFVKRIGDPDYPQGKLIVSYMVAQALAGSQSKLLASVVPFTAVLLLVTVIFVLELQRRSLRPLYVLINKMRGIEVSKDYDIAVEVRGKKEIVDLTQGFNSMMSDIARQVEMNKQKNALLIRQQEQMEELANFDSLTGLPNRQFLMKCLSIEMARAKRENRELALMFLDLDGFKLVNDSFGHDVGDKLLCHVADQASDCLRKGDVLGRLGGDEFIIMLSANPLIVHIKEVAQRLVDKLAQPHHIEQWKLDTGVSIGIALATDCRYDLTKLVANADIAMYRSKQAGRGQYTLFTQAMQDDNRRMMFIATSIMQAIDNDEFTLFYQPKVGLDGQIKGFEALLRWYNKELGFVSPGEFIPIAEQSDKVSAITEWVASRVCRDLPEILATFGQDVHVSLNLSACDLANSRVTEFIINRIQNLGMPTTALEFEITESAYLESFQAGNVFFEQVRNLGCKIALDDFGTGYSSLSYLTEFYIDTLKIDKQFVSQIGSSRRSELITITIIEMARQLNLTVCAEGVETSAQSDFLTLQGCDLQQGFLYGRPEPLRTLLTNHLTHSTIAS